MYINQVVQPLGKQYRLARAFSVGLYGCRSGPHFSLSNIKNGKILIDGIPVQLGELSGTSDRYATRVQCPIEAKL